MKKILLTTASFCLLTAGLMAQGSTNLGKPTKKNIITTNANQAVSSGQGVHVKNRCGTAAPSAEWDAAFNKDVEAYKTKLASDMANGRTTATTYTIPIIFHIIHGGQAVGTYPNLAQAQINSQITVLNQDYGGTGYKSNTYPAGAFAAYAALAANNVAAASKDGTGRIAIANCGITFCPATKNPSGVTLAEPGIDRISYVTKSWTNPATLTSANFQSYIDGTIKPGSVWDVTKYFNVWLTDEDMTSTNSPGLLGYSTFPPSSTNTGLSAPYGTTTTDGCWFYSKVCGSANIYAAGTYDPTYKYGRTICHEAGHWLGLRHPWGDNGQCGATDYCNDTPPEQGQATNQPYGCWYGTNTYPVNAGTCTFGGQTNTNGDMFMNIMDYTDDIGMYMFTNDQAIRMQTSMAHSPYRTGLTASAANLCSGVTTTYTTIAGAFTYPSSICTNAAAAFTDASTGGPVSSWAWSVTPSAGVTINTATSQNPTITFTSANTYTVTMAATNTVNTSTVSHVVTVSSCTTSSCDTVGNIVSADTLTVYNVTKGYLSGTGLVVSGTTSLTSQAIAETYASSTFPTNVTQVKGAIILFYRDVANNIGTKGTSALTLKMTGTTTASSGIVPNTTAAATQTLSLSSVVASANTTGPDYAGNQLYNFTGYMKAYPVMFTTPVTIPSTFALSLSLPTTTTSDSVVVFSNTGHVTTAATGCVQYKSGTTSTWYNTSAFSLNLGFGIIPIVCPATTGIEANYLGSNITLFPNPNSGYFNFAVTLPEATNLNFTVVNMLGQVVYTKSENNVLNSVLSCDLTHLAKGVYYATIMDSNNNKTVKKIIIE